MFGFRRIFDRRQFRALTLALTAICVAPLAIPAFASPVSMLDENSDAAATRLKASAPTIDNATMRSVAPLAALRNNPDLDSASSGGGLSSASLGATPSSSGLVGQNASSERSANSGSLRDVLQALVIMHQSDGAAAGPQKSARPRRKIAADEPDLDLRKLILDSEVAGTMLRSIVEIKSADAHGATFSIFGLGNFAVDVAPELHAAIVSELSSGLGVRMALTGDGRSYDAYPQSTINNANLAPHERVNYIRIAWNWILDFLSSPVGALLAMSAAISLFLWICVKSVVFLQRRAARYERS